MSLLLIVGIALLVGLGGLAWLQRLATRDLSTRPGQRPGATTPVAGPAGPPDRVRPTLVTDPVFGDLTFNGTDSWTCDDDLKLAGQWVEVLVMADAEGPQDTHRAWMQAALARFDALDTEARTVLASALAPLGLSRADLTPWQISIGPMDDETVFEGRVGYDSMHELVDEAYVRSTAMWDDLEPHVTLEGGEEVSGPSLRQRIVPLLGLIVYSGEESWSNAEPFRFGGRDVSVVLLAGPEGPTPEHDAWLQALAARDAALPTEGAALARTALRHLAATTALTVPIVVIGPDENGRFIGSLCFDWPGKGDARCDVWSRDRWATLSLERG